MSQVVPKSTEARCETAFRLERKHRHNSPPLTWMAAFLESQCIYTRTFCTDVASGDDDDEHDDGDDEEDQVLGDGYDDDRVEHLNLC